MSIEGLTEEGIIFIALGSVLGILIIPWLLSLPEWLEKRKQKKEALTLAEAEE